MDNGMGWGVYNGKPIHNMIFLTQFNRKILYNFYHRGQKENRNIFPDILCKYINTLYIYRGLYCV